ASQLPQGPHNPSILCCTCGSWLAGDEFNTFEPATTGSKVAPSNTRPWFGLHGGSSRGVFDFAEQQ
ncbi:hypothetical protein, partial [Pseudomonas sp. XP1]